MGTSELYSAVEALPEVLDSLVVDLEYLGRDSYMPLFVVLRPGVMLDEAMREKINDAIRTALSPRFVPNDIFEVAEIPRTLSGKKQELPVKKLLLGQPLEKVVNRDAMANPGCLDWYVDFARRRSSAPELEEKVGQAAGLRFTRTMPAATPASASMSCAVSGSCSSATPSTSANTGVRKVNDDICVAG